MRTINGIRFKDQWSELTLEDYAMITGIRMDDKSELIDQNFKLLAYLSGKDESIFDDMDYEQLTQYMPVLAFLDEEIKGDMQDVYTIAGKDYRLTSSLKRLKKNQWQDIIHYTKNQEDLQDNLHEICAIILLPAKKLPRKYRFINRLYRFGMKYEKSKREIEKRGITPYLPDAEKYMVSPPDERAELLFKHLTVTQAMGIYNRVFFCSLLYIKCFLDFSEQTMMKQLKLLLTSLNEEQKMTNSQEIQTITDNLKTLEDLQNIGGGLL